MVKQQPMLRESYKVINVTGHSMRLAKLKLGQVDRIFATATFKAITILTERMEYHQTISFGEHTRVI
eukprot:9785559-Ditylum_brightwellii.AAC.1